MEDIKHYFLLLTILSLGFGLFWLFNFNREIQILITLGLGVSYIIWGIIHHALKKELYSKIILEYFLVAFFACILVVFLLLRT